VSTGQADFEAFYRDAKDRCLVTVLVSVGDPDVAQELVAEAFARAWASWSKVSKHPAPQAWVVRTALNVGVSRWRKRRREIATADPTLVADAPSVAGTSAELDPTIMAALRRLPERQRQVVALRLLLDLDTTRSAEVLGIAPGTVQAHLGRAMATLRADVVPQLQKGGSP
jgi:RNA polymerase sigma factor (sigma-70 family)